MTWRRITQPESLQETITITLLLDPDGIHALPTLSANTNANGMDSAFLSDVALLMCSIAALRASSLFTLSLFHPRFSSNLRSSPGR
jgi:hypothetical protein